MNRLSSAKSPEESRGARSTSELFERGIELVAGAPHVQVEPGGRKARSGDVVAVRLPDRGKVEHLPGTRQPRLFTESGLCLPGRCPPRGLSAVHPEEGDGALQLFGLGGELLGG